MTSSIWTKEERQTVSKIEIKSWSNNERDRETEREGSCRESCVSEKDMQDGVGMFRVKVMKPTKTTTSTSLPQFELPTWQRCKWTCFKNTSQGWNIEFKLLVAHYLNHAERLFNKCSLFLLSSYENKSDANDWWTWNMIHCVTFQTIFSWENATTTTTCYVLLGLSFNFNKHTIMRDKKR